MARDELAISQLPSRSALMPLPDPLPSTEMAAVRLILLYASMALRVIGSTVVEPLMVIFSGLGPQWKANEMVVKKTTRITDERRPASDDFIMHLAIELRYGNYFLVGILMYGPNMSGIETVLYRLVRDNLTRANKKIPKSTDNVNIFIIREKKFKK
jgi:hypothetical protein